MLSRKKIDALWEQAHVIAPNSDARTFRVLARLVEAEALRSVGSKKASTASEFVASGLPQEPVVSTYLLLGRSKQAAKAAKEGK